MMNETLFPLPEARKLSPELQLRREADQFSALSAREGALILVSQAAKLLGVSPQAVADLIARRKLESWALLGHRWVVLDEVVSRRDGPRPRAGRPRKEAA